MQERHIEELIGGNDLGMTPGEFANKVEAETKEFPAGTRGVTPDEIKAMRAFVQAYRKQHPRAKDREIRRVMQKKFNVKIIANQ